MSKKVKFNKSAVVNSDKYGEYRDLLNVILKDEVVYTFEEVDKLINEFLTREVQ